MYMFIWTISILLRGAAVLLIAREQMLLSDEFRRLTSFVFTPLLHSRDAVYGTPFF